MKQSLKIGLSFGITSGTITTLGLLVGLASSSEMKMVVIGGILTIAIADAMSDALGIHISQESDKTNSHKEVWESTIATFLAKFCVASTFILPVLFLPLWRAVGASVIRGLSLITYLSRYIAKTQHESPLHSIGEHVGIASLVVVITYFVGKGVALMFG